MRSGGHSGGRAALSAIHSGMVGNERSSSMMRWMMLSVVPPSTTPTSPMDSEMRSP